ncbi:MAG: ATP-binding cassette domain-containing protein [Actinomycetaceae bacterium]|nr:ATP-binding cassette domain-containing protein [Actinomycetaceae bacterium]
MDKPLVHAQSLTKSFGKNTAINNISFNIPRQSIYAFVGPNGAGKSTTLKILSGIIRPDSGQILFDGEPFTRKHLKRIGALIEQPAIYPNLSAYDNCKVAGLLRDIPLEEIGRCLEIVGLDKTGKKRAGAFSVGMKQRLGIAMALMGNPEFLILDEPTSGLDPQGVNTFHALIKNYVSDGGTAIISSHNLENIGALANRCLIVNNGATVYEGEMKDKNLETLYWDHMTQEQGW